VLPKEMAHWSLTSLRERLIKIGPRLVRHARCIIFQMAEVAVPKQLFASIWGPIWAFTPVGS